jgi:hypothetical protein
MTKVLDWLGVLAVGLMGLVVLGVMSLQLIRDFISSF